MPIGPELAEWALRVFNQFEDLQRQVEETTLAALTSALTGPASDTALERLRERAKERAKQITGNLLQTELNTIYDTIRKGVENGDGIKEIAERLDDIRGLDKNRAAQYEKMKAYLEENGVGDIEAQLERYYEKLLADRKRTITKTEVVEAQQTARLEEAKTQGAKWKVWVTSGDSRVSDIDIANEAQGAIPLDKAFQSGHMRPPSHPICRCSTSFAVSDAAKAQIEKTAKQRQELIEQSKEEVAA